MPHHLTSDVHEWINEIPTVSIYYLAMIIPPSTVNVMSNEEDCCFQCQEPGHTAQHCPHIRCYECDEYGHIVMDCPNRIPPSMTSVTYQKAHKGSPCEIEFEAPP